MKQEDKELLLQDLCCRLPYGVKGAYILGDTVWSEEPEIIVNIDLQKEKIWTDDTIRGYDIEDQDFKPYLRPLSSMTEKEQEELFKIDEKRVIFSSRHLTWHLDGEVTDYLNKKMFDWRGLIPKGLALPALEGMYNVK